MRLNERYGEIEYGGGRVIERWRGSSGNVRLSRLPMSFLFRFDIITSITIGWLRNSG